MRFAFDRVGFAQELFDFLPAQSRSSQDPTNGTSRSTSIEATFDKLDELFDGPIVAWEPMLVGLGLCCRVDDLVGLGWREKGGAPPVRR